jgi:3-deoxy-7-phosphoheptulonate synthase
MSFAPYPPLVFAGEARRLTAKLAEVEAGNAFLLAGRRLRRELQGILDRQHPRHLPPDPADGGGPDVRGRKPVVKVGRIAGQFAKPRSSSVEQIDGVELPSYRGDIINGMAFTPEERLPDPQRLLRAYNQSASTLNLLRAFAGGRLCRPVQHPSLDHGLRRRQRLCHKYRELADKITEALAFMEAVGVTPESHPDLSRVEVFTSHEALLLNLESALTRLDGATGEWFDTSAHMVWIGERTRQPDGAHIEFARGIKNPIGLKCGPTMEPDDLLTLIDALNPDNDAGPADADRALRRRQGGRSPAAPDAGGEGERQAGGLVDRSDARQHAEGRQRLQDPAVRTRSSAR